MPVTRKSRNFSGDTILFVSWKRRRSKTRNCTDILIFLPITSCGKTSFTEQAGRSFTDGFSDPKSFRDFRGTGPWPYVTSVPCGSFNKPQMFVGVETQKKATVLFKTILLAQLTNVLTGNKLKLEKRGVTVFQFSAVLSSKNHSMSKAILLAFYLNPNLCNQFVETNLCKKVFYVLNWPEFCPQRLTSDYETVPSKLYRLNVNMSMRPVKFWKIIHFAKHLLIIYSCRRKVTLTGSINLAVEQWHTQKMNRGN